MRYTFRELLQSERAYMLRRVFCLGLLLMAALPAGAYPLTNVIISQTASSNLYTSYAPVYAGWTQTSTYSGIAITANLASNGTGTATGRGYLVSSQPPTTVASQVGSAGTPFSIPSTTTTFAPITLFTGLTLGPGTYYLVISNDSGDVLSQAALASSTTVNLASGVTATANSLFDGTQATYPPASTAWYNKGQLILFSVTGTLVVPLPPAVPALSVWAMLATAILLAASGLLFVRKFKPAA